MIRVLTAIFRKLESNYRYHASKKETVAGSFFPNWKRSLKEAEQHFDSAKLHVFLLHLICKK